MKPIKLEHVEKLSRGKPSGIHAGSRAVGHHLRAHERSDYQRALKKGYLEINANQRDNLWNIWEKACLAQRWSFLVLIKEPSTGKARIYRDNDEILLLDLKLAKAEIKTLASNNLPS